MVRNHWKNRGISRGFVAAHQSRSDLPVKVMLPMCNDAGTTNVPLYEGHEKRLPVTTFQFSAKT